MSRRHFGQVRNRLELDDDVFLNKLVEPLSFDDASPVIDVSFHLPLKTHVTKVELNTQRLFVNRFEESRTENPVYFNRCSNDLFG